MMAKLTRPVFCALLAAHAIVLPLHAEEPAAEFCGPPAPPPAEVRPPPTATPATGAPPEAELGAPPTDVETSPADLRLVKVPNPAFPSARAAAAPPPPGRSYSELDIAPYFTSTTLALARAEFDKGRYSRVVTLLANQGNAPPVRYLRALAALRGDDPKLAAKLFEGLLEDYPAMRDRILTHTAVAYEDLGRLERSAELFGQVEPGSRLYPDARLGMFRVLRRKGDAAGAAKALKPLTERPTPGFGRDLGAEALIALADLAASRKDKVGERAALIALWGSHPLSRLADQAERRLKGVTLPLSAKISRAEVYIDAHRNQQGLKILEPLLPQLKLPDADACRAHFAYGKALRKERSHTKAIGVLTPVAAACKDKDLLPRVLYVLGSSRSIVDISGGPQTYERLAREFPEHSFADDALFYAADLYVKAGAPEKALRTLGQLADRYPQGDFAAEGLFKAFWTLRAMGQHERAKEHLDRIESLYANNDESYDVERARYWRARMLENAGQTQKAAALFEALAVEHPATYYGLIARRRVGELAPEKAAIVAERIRFPRTSANPWPMNAGTLSDDSHFLAGVELMRLGFLEAAPAELLSADRSATHPEGMRLLVHLLSRTGDQRSAHAVARTALRRDLSGRVTERTRAVWEIAYPRAFRDIVEKHSKPAGVDPDLLQALMREESALDPNIRSWAGALGLTQLMPATAKAVARQLKIRCVIPNGLFEPDLNVRLGSHYLGTLVKQWKGTFEHALASYNAGPRSVQRWKENLPSAELDEWVEEIPIAETRGYVKRVLRSYNTYQRLYPPEDASVRATRAPTGFAK